MKKREIIAGLELPLDAVTRRMAMLATSGAGKTYAAMKLAELMLEAGNQVIVLDVAGPWWGLRVGKDGSSPGFNLALFGGPRGDIPIVPEAGALIADTLVDTRVSAVIDLSEFSDAEIARFGGAFAERFFLRKKRSPSPVHLFIEEAHELMPQNPERDQNVMLNRWKRLTRQGRNHGIGWTLVSQAPQSLNKRCLNLAECVFTLRLFGAHERDAVIDWVADVAPDPRAATAQINREAPYLEDGFAFVWSPQWLKRMGAAAAKILPKRTFDSSKTPEPGDLVVDELPAPKALDLEHLAEAMNETVERAKLDDPKALRAEVARLRAELDKVTAATLKSKKVQTEKVEVLVVKDAQVKQLENAVAKLQKTGELFEGAQERIVQVAGELLAELQRAAAARAPAPAAPLQPLARTIQRRTAQADAAPPRPRPNGVPDFRKGAREMLRQLARMGSLTRQQLATLSGMSPKSGTFSTYLGELKRAGFIIEEGGQNWAITAEGRAYAGPVEGPPATPAELVAMWSRRFRAGARKMLELLVDVYPNAISLHDIATSIGMSPESGTFSTYLGELRRNGLIEKNAHGHTGASPSLFIGSQRGGA